jgi:two-component system, NtrC family, nitrogen regulation sensor histidine kinase GlnL
MCTNVVHYGVMENVSWETKLEQDLVDHLATAILVVGADSKLVRMNAAAETLLGVSIRQAVGSRVEMLWPETEALNLAIVEVAASGQAMEFRDLTLKLPAQDQALSIDCIVSGLPQPIGIRKVIIEMQPSDRDRTLVRDAEHQAQQRLAHRMVLNLAHELRNPLAGLRGAAQLLEQNLPRADLKEYTRIIIGETDRLDTLVSQMLGPQQPPRRTMVNLHQPLEQVRRLIAASQENSLEIERDYDPSLPQLLLDPDQLTQTLLNLLRNACQALADTPDPGSACVHASSTTWSSVDGVIGSAPASA